MNKTCSICGKKSDGYCEACTIFLKALRAQYTIPQLMAMFSHAIGWKITTEITETMYQTLRDSYKAKTMRKEGRLN